MNHFEKNYLQRKKSRVWNRTLTTNLEKKKKLKQKADAGKFVLIVTIVACFALEIYALIRILLEFMLMGEYFMESIFKTLIN